MKEIRIHGRGGQGSVVTAELLASAAFKDGLYSQAFPFLGAGERRGAPVQAFCRIDDQPIELKCQITEPGYLLLQDPSVTDVVDVFAGLQDGGMVLVNTSKPPEELGFNNDLFDIYYFPATEVAMEVLNRPIMNTAMIGAFAAITGELRLESIKEAIKEKFPGQQGEKNALAAEKAFEQAMLLRKK